MGITCTFCHTSISSGATVCTGCQAEVEYGPDFKQAGYAGLAVGLITSAPMDWSGVAFILGFFIGFGFLVYRQKDRINIKRAYKWKER